LKTDAYLTIAAKSKECAKSCISPQTRSAVALSQLQGRAQSRREFSTLSDHLLKDVGFSPREIEVLRNIPRPAIETVAGDTPNERERLQLVLRDAAHSTEAKLRFRPARKTCADLEQQLYACRREIDDLREQLVEATKQQSATSEMLRIISNSPVQSVLDAVAENAARLCDSANAEIFRLENDLLRLVASHGEIPVNIDARAGLPANRLRVIGRAACDR
jgi:uncharacterized protein YjiS (DUF1127 family)